MYLLMSYHERHPSIESSNKSFRPAKESEPSPLRASLGGVPRTLAWDSYKTSCSKLFTYHVCIHAQHYVWNLHINSFVLDIYSIHFTSAIGVDVAGTSQGLFASCGTQLLAAQDDSTLVMKRSFEKMSWNLRWSWIHSMIFSRISSLVPFFFVSS